MKEIINVLVCFIMAHNGINDKTKLSLLVAARFDLIKDRSVIYNNIFAIRFSKANSDHFGNTVLSLSALQKYDDKPFFVCVVCPEYNLC